ncbi:GroES-like protein [Suhomyces tanzawaensis NRRL Y-17324]|uniref:GroES-like protein n=1 Tax=Suhomyces tanzawaensis NRRL Y-17324 TaxID=984487 RepID=A0A1E4SL74_9ASCO|nr:GroES-like protein [Suhomyces tanzawaensis NRRL Y-17324]ODV80259.1 GroES-like protein [Suhomyces tanzawaensis NRRL Y-17324]
MTIGTAPQTFKGFGVDDFKNWDSPKLVEYAAKPLNDHDVIVETIACGVCGSDLFTINGAWGPLGRKDLVVGHEIIGNVVALGDLVTEFKLGQRVGIGAANSACRECSRCASDNEQYCPTRSSTYNSVDPRSDGYVTQGGYASHAIADEQFVFAIPDKISSSAAAPMMCAGLTVFSPLVRTLGYDAKGKTVGIIGIGGLGHLAIQFGHAIGANVVAFSRSSSKKDHAISMGADDFVATGEDPKWTSRYMDKFDLILNCASGIDGLALTDYLSVLKVNGSFISAGLPSHSETFEVAPKGFLKNGGSFGSSSLGSKVEANEMLRLAAEYDIKPWVEEIDISEKGVHEALTRLDKGDVKYRFVFTGFDKAF